MATWDADRTRALFADIKERGAKMLCDGDDLFLLNPNGRLIKWARRAPTDPWSAEVMKGLVEEFWPSNGEDALTTVSRHLFAEAQSRGYSAGADENGRFNLIRPDGSVAFEASFDDCIFTKKELEKILGELTPGMKVS